MSYPPSLSDALGVDPYTPRPRGRSFAESEANRYRENTFASGAATPAPVAQPYSGVNTAASATDQYNGVLSRVHQDNINNGADPGRGYTFAGVNEQGVARYVAGQPSIQEGVGVRADGLKAAMTTINRQLPTSPFNV